MFDSKNIGIDPSIMVKLKDSSEVYAFKKGNKDISTLLTAKMYRGTSTLDGLIIERFKCLILKYRINSLIMLKIRD